jgi:hypothetical protein
MSVQAWLDEGARFDAEYRGGLSNHLPMALLALQRLGASETQIDTFATRYVKRLEPASKTVMWSSGEHWLDRLGKREAWPAYRNLFSAWIGRDGSDVVLAQALPKLMAGCGAAAFHGIIRTAYAAHSGHDRELSDGLAYWACRHLPLGVAAGDGTVADPMVVLQNLRTRPSDRDLIFESMRDAAQECTFDPLIKPLKVDDATLSRLSRVAAMLYTSSGNFTVLHLVTSSHALRVLLPFLDDPLPSLHAYWRAYAAGYVASGLRPNTVANLQPWDEIIDVAIASDDEHVVKLVDSCREEERAYGGDDWRHAASRAVARTRT